MCVSTDLEWGRRCSPVPLVRDKEVSATPSERSSRRSASGLENELDVDVEGSAAPRIGGGREALHLRQEY